VRSVTYYLPTLLSTRFLVNTSCIHTIQYIHTIHTYIHTYNTTHTYNTYTYIQYLDHTRLYSQINLATNTHTHTHAHTHTPYINATTYFERSSVSCADGLDCLNCPFVSKINSIRITTHHACCADVSGSVCCDTHTHTHTHPQGARAAQLCGLLPVPAATCARGCRQAQQYVQVCVCVCWGLCLGVCVLSVEGCVGWGMGYVCAVCCVVWVLQYTTKMHIICMQEPRGGTFYTTAHDVFAHTMCNILYTHTQAKNVHAHMHFFLEHIRMLSYTRT